MAPPPRAFFQLRLRLPLYVSQKNVQHDQVSLVEGNDLKERGTRITVHNVESHTVTVLLELGLVRLHALNSLLTQLTEKLVLLLRVDRERTRCPRAREDISRKHSHKEDVAALVDGLALKHIVEGLVTSFGAVEGK